MHDLDLPGRQPDAVDAEAPHRLADRDHARRPPRQRPLGEAERPGAERVRVVLRRDEPHARRERAVHVRVHEMGVDEVTCRSERSVRASRNASARIEVARRANRSYGTVELAVEGVEHTRRVVEPDERHVDPAFGQRRQQREQVPLGPADAPDPVDVDDFHGTVRGAVRRAVSQDHMCTIATPAASASVKSHGTR